MEKSKISNHLLYEQIHFDLFLKLNLLSFDNKINLNKVLDEITEALTAGLNLERASFWRIQGDKLVCINLYDATTKLHSIESDLLSRDLPIYFKALSDGIAIVADDAKTNYYTQELKDIYLLPNGITDMLDLPIRENGKVTAVLCCEHKDDEREWSSVDLAFSRSIADILTLLIEQNKNKLINEKLLDSERKISLITQNSPDGFVVIENGKITFISPTYAELLGYPYQEILTFNVDAIFNKIHPEDILNVKSYIQQNLTNKASTFKYEYRARSISGDYFWREDTVSVIYNNHDKYSKLMIISRDISALKNANLEIQKLFEITKIQNEKLMDFTYIISHNIRSNSCNISMILDLLEQTDDENEKKQYFQLLKESNEKLTETLYHLNESINSKSNAKNEKTILNVRNEIVKSLQILNGIIESSNVKVKLIVDNNLAINTIPIYLESILFNLISNAVKYKSDNKDALIEIKAEKVDRNIILSIKDNGIGIDLEKNKDKLFGMYKTFHNNNDAVGLGLFMTKSYIDSLNGTIDVESAIDLGSTFKVTFS